MSTRLRRAYPGGALSFGACNNLGLKAASLRSDVPFNGLPLLLKPPEGFEEGRSFHLKLQVVG